MKARLLGTLAMALLVSGCGAESPSNSSEGNGGASAGSGGSATGGGGTTAAGSGGSSAGSAGKANTGGSSAAGGSGGANQAGAGSGGGGGSVPHLVADCAGLGSVGEWEDISPPDVPKVMDAFLSVLADPINAGTIYTGTAAQGLWKSENCGADWYKVNTGTKGDALDTGWLWEIEIDRADPAVLYAGSLYSNDNSLLKSTNGGVDWASMFPAGGNVATTVEYNFLQGVAIDPTDHEHLVVTFHANCIGGDLPPGCMGESFDSGATWRLFKSPLGGWSEGAGPIAISGATFLFQTPQDGVFFTEDAGEHWQNVTGGGFPQVYRASTGMIYMGSFSGVHRSQDDGKTWNKTEGAPLSVAVIGDGQRIFASWDVDGKAAYWAATESNGADWQPISAPDVTFRGENFAYEDDHHVLYAAHRAGGVWRMVTR